jgi:sortase A
MTDRALAPTKDQNWRRVSYFLSVSGLLLILAGGWLWYQQQQETQLPPHVRVVEAPLIAASPSPTSTSTRRPPNTSTPTRVPDTPTPTRLPDTPTPTTVIITQTHTIVIFPTATATTPPSLNDNPLTVAPTAGSAEPAAAALTRVVAESIGLDAPVVEVGWQEVVENGVSKNVWEVADKAAGWHKNSKLPGQGGNIVLSGHHNVKGEVFRYLIDLQPGDVITLYAGGQAYPYVVRDVLLVKDKGEPPEVRQANAQWIAPVAEERLTLVTCWPYSNNTHRVIVVAHPQ